MSFKRILISGIAAAIVAGAVLGTAQQSSAGSLSPGEAATIAGIGGFIIGATIANSQPAYHGHYSGGYQPANSWEAHVARCYARYRSYDHRTDT
ncbi:MAG TPA: BA14K family protein [Pseudaminobacter sp.]|nr:BA14K family protein [Pseudaminobacter sp.]